MTSQPTRSAPPSPTEPDTVDQRTMRLVFTTVALEMLLAALDQTIVSTALPSIVSDLGGAGPLSWVVTSVEEMARRHHLPSAVLEPAFGHAAEQGYLRRADGRLALTSAGVR